MKRIASLLVAVAMGALLVAYTTPTSGQGGEAASPIYGLTIPAGYRDWKLISVGRLGGSNNDLRAKLGNDVAIKAYRKGKIPFPDGTIIARLAWREVTSEENDMALGDVHSFVTGSATNLEFMVKDSKKYAATGGRGLPRNLPTANQTARRSTKPVFRATSLQKIKILSLPVTPLDPARDLLPKQRLRDGSRLPGDHDGCAGTAHLGQIAGGGQADLQGLPLSANDRTVVVGLRQDTLQTSPSGTSTVAGIAELARLARAGNGSGLLEGTGVKNFEPT